MDRSPSQVDTVKMAAQGTPQTLLSVPDGMFLVIGMVIGVGIFKLPSLVAGNTTGEGQFLFAWLLGGVISLCGAFVYAELSSRHPVTGGEYTFLLRGLGPGAAFLFVWSRMTVIQTGVIVAVAFAFGDYASEVLRLGENSSAVWAAGSVVALTALNVVGTFSSKTLQKGMEIVLIVALVLISIAALVIGGTPKPAAPGSGGHVSFGLAMVFVLFTYGGWNEAAYLAGEVRDARRNMLKILVAGIVGVTALYLLVNLAYLSMLGIGGVRESKAVAADVMRLLAGEKGVALIAILVCISAATTMNAAIFTGARTTWAFAQDFPLFARLGAWRVHGSTPSNALLLQGAISLILVWAASYTRDGFQAMVDYTAPVFWVFFLLTGMTLFVFRRRGREMPEIRTPLYPLFPIVFCLMCGYMIYSTVSYALADYGPKFGNMVLTGIVVMLAGIPLYFLARRK